MKRALREHSRDVLAVAGLVVLGLVSTWIIVQNQRLRVPFIEETPFQLKAEMETAQAVAPGQGQTVRVAGVRVGDVADVEYEDGTAVVTMDIDREFLPVYEDATVLLRPTTGLKDMFLELDPGTPSAGEFDEGGEIPVANTAPDVNLDEILEALDSDTQAYLRLLLTGAGDGLEDNGENLGEVLGSLGPINKGLARLNGEVAKRKENLARLVHNMNTFFGRLGQEDEEIAAVIDSSNSALSAIAGEDLDVRRATGLLGPTLRDTRIALAETNDLATILKPALADLRPFARRLKPINESLGKLARTTRSDVKHKIRPFVRAAREPVRDLRPASKALADATPKLVTITRKINKLGNMAAYNPNGAEPPGAPSRDEGYLYWIGWLGHVGNSTFQAQDAHGLYRRIYLTASCQTVLTTLNATPLSGLINNVGPLLGLCP
jgi:phospholipid/cholesterol/gamma-HCH transport system substrate-binding protein